MFKECSQQGKKQNWKKGIIKIVLTKQENPERNWNELVIAEFRENDNMYIGKYILVVIFLSYVGNDDESYHELVGLMNFYIRFPTCHLRYLQL